HLEIVGAGGRAGEGKLRLRQVDAESGFDLIQVANGAAREWVFCQQQVHVSHVPRPVAGVADVMRDGALSRSLREKLGRDGKVAQGLLGGGAGPKGRGDAADVHKSQLVLALQQADGQAGDRLEALVLAETYPGTP